MQNKQTFQTVEELKEVIVNNQSLTKVIWDFSSLGPQAYQNFGRLLHELIPILQAAKITSLEILHSDTKLQAFLFNKIPKTKNSGLKDVMQALSINCNITFSLTCPFTTYGEYVFTQPPKIEQPTIQMPIFRTIEDLYEILFSDKPLSGLVWDSQAKSLVAQETISKLDEFLEIICQKPEIKEVIISHSDIQEQRAMLNLDEPNGMRYALTNIYNTKKINFKCVYEGSEILPIFNVQQDVKKSKTIKHSTKLQNTYSCTGARDTSGRASIHHSSSIIRKVTEVKPDQVTVVVHDKDDYLASFLQWRFSQNHHYFRDPDRTLIFSINAGEFYLNVERYKSWIETFASRNGIAKKLEFPADMIFRMCASYLADSDVTKYEWNHPLNGTKNAFYYDDNQRRALIPLYHFNPFKRLNAQLAEHNITQLYLQNMMLGDRKIIELTAALYDAIELDVIDLTGNNMTHVSSTKVGQLVGRYESFTYVNLSANKLGPLGCLQFLQSLSETKDIDYLDLSANRLGDDKDDRSKIAKKELLGNLFCNTQVCSISALVLQSNMLTGKDIDDIINLENLAFVEQSLVNYLDLSNNLIDRSDTLIKFLKCTNTVQALFINDNPLDPIFKMQLLGSAITGKAVQILECARTPLDSQCIALLNGLKDAGSLVYLKCTADNGVMPDSFQKRLESNKNVLLQIYNSKQGIEDLDTLSTFYKIVFRLTPQSSEFGRWVSQEIKPHLQLSRDR